VIAAAVPLCAECLESNDENVKAKLAQSHARARVPFGLPEHPPQTEGGISCNFCARDCRMGLGETGYCGLRENREGRLHHHAGTARAGLLQYYFDPLPTNCVADWVCAGSKQRRSYNLAVFYGGCTFNCLNCQNWHHRELVTARRPLVSADELADAADERTFCICFFGGDPSCQMPHSLATARRLAERGVRTCWETNGSMNPRFLRSALKLSRATGGIIKFDLKAYSEGIHRALTGSGNGRTLDNFALAVDLSANHSASGPGVVASTLLVPGYVGAAEVGRIASFIAELNPDTPYALLAFYPQFLLSDLPRTSRRHGEEAQAAARAAGLQNVRLGNLHLLGSDY
jgi:pyruvate formate lyase activating enzyme